MIFSCFQRRVSRWLIKCFGYAIADNRVERNHRFLEEALELVQACGTSKEECLQLIDYVYSRPIGKIHQEIGGVSVTFNALCYAHSYDREMCEETELERCWEKIEKIRAKQAAKPKFSPLPEEQS